MLRAALVSMMAVVPAISFAQSVQNGPVTRAQVLQEIVDLESVGYNPAVPSNVMYPQDVQDAMRRLAEKRANAARLAHEQQMAQSAVGAQPEPATGSGSPAGR
jgi:hypothetical protein